MPFGGQFVLLRNAAKEMQLMVPNHEMHPLGVKGDPFRLFVLPDRGSLTWQESVNTPYYMYGVHTSATFLLPPTLASALYLVVSLLARRQYALALRYAEGCYVDTRFSVEERFMFALAHRTVQDMHPDAHAVRLKLAHTVLMSENSVPWELHSEIFKYLAKLRYVSSDCKLSAEETIDLMKRCERASALVKAQLQFWHHASQHEHDASTSRVKIDPPTPKVCGQAWGKLVMLNRDAVMNQTIRPKRLHYQIPKTLPFAEKDLINSIWSDDLLTDEESGSNRQLGFGFLFEIAGGRRGILPITINNTDVSSSITELLIRFFHLRHSRWGRESVEDGEVDFSQSYAMSMLATMLLDPMSTFPEWNTRDMRAALQQGVNLAGPEARETGIFDWWQQCEYAMNRAFNETGTMTTLSRQVRLAQRAVVDAESARVRIITPLEVSPEERAALRVHGRPFPSNTGRECITLPIGDEDDKHPIARSLCFVPLSAAGWHNIVKSEMPSSVVSADDGTASASAASKSLLPFPELAAHPAANTHIAQDLLNRLEQDMATYHDQQKKTSKHFFCLSSGSSDRVSFAALFADIFGGEKQQQQAASGLRDTFATELMGLWQRLATLAESDQQHVATGVSRALKLANTDHVTDERAGVAASDVRSRLSKHERRVRALTFEWLCGAIASTKFGDDVASANPSHGNIAELELLLVATMMRANRVRFAQLAMQQIATLVSFVRACHSKLQQQADDAAAHSGGQDAGGAGGAHADALVSPATMGGRFDLLATQLLETLTASRNFTTVNVNESESTVSLDPRFMIFEFLFAFLLRPRQVEMVQWFVKSVRDEGISRVQQMLMGQGKTTVVGPLLALILADQKTLVTQVTPTALLDQTRNVLRRCFSVVVPKKILTLEFDRTWGGGGTDKEGGSSLGKIEMLLQKLNSARRSGAIIVSAPECIKALQLKIVEMLHTVEEATVPGDAADATDVHGGISEIVSDLQRAAAGRASDREVEELEGLKKRLVARSLTADNLAPVVADLWRSSGVLLMDEVDVLLHPLKSELNFPIGHKHPLDGSGPRWNLPIHLLDAILACTKAAGRFSSPLAAQPQHADEAARALATVAGAIQLGFARQALQREPHLVLLDVGFYHETLVPALLPWVMMWIRSAICPPPPPPPPPPPQSQPQQPQQLPPKIPCEAAVLEFIRTADVPSPALAAEIHNNFAPAHVQLLNLARSWMQTILPHVLSKISRVGFGLLQPEDESMLRTIGADSSGAGPTVSRRLLSVPFVAKDVPSRSSEFAHPDVVIGLTILAFRYEGLRKSDVRDVVQQLQEDCARQHGPRERRPAAVLYNQWMQLAMEQRSKLQKQTLAQSGSHVSISDMAGAGGVDSADATGGAGAGAGAGGVDADGAAVQKEEEMIIVPLGQLHIADPVQLDGLHAALCRVPEVAHHHLCQHVFPRTMLFQQLKVSASGHELGSSILFSKRIGFSGTPGNLLPLDLGDCSYEPGSDGRIVTVLTSPQVTSAEVLPAEWSPRGVLEKIARAEPPAHALIDVGALITNMGNEQVARFLLAKLSPERFDAVVFLDAQDRHVALVRANWLVLPIAQCGVPLSRRFTFFDQVHTTGTDVKQAPAARAVITVGKDTVFRDYAQGAFRMRGIGKGQTIDVYLIPEVAGRIKDMLGRRFATGRPEVDIPAWLLLNTMRMEALQFLKLCEQEISNVFRKRALGVLLEDCVGREARKSSSTDWQNCLRFVAKKNVDDGGDGASLQRALGCAIRIFREALGFPLHSRVEPPQSIDETLRARVDDLCAKCIAAGMPLSEDERRRLELVIDRLSGPATSSATSTKHGGADDDAAPATTTTTDSDPAASEAEAKAAGRHKAETGLVVSAAQAGLNTEVVHEQEQEQEQEQEAEQEEQRESAYSRDDEQPISWAADVVSLNPANVAAAAVAAAAAASGDSKSKDAADSAQRPVPFYEFSRFRIRAQQPLLDGLVQEFQLTDNLFRPRWFGAGDRRLKNVVVFLQLLRSSSTQRPTFVALSLAEAESLRWLVHRSAVCNLSCSFALRATMSNAVIDATDVFVSVVDPPQSELLANSARASLFYRFFNNDMFFSDEEIALMEERVLDGVADRAVRIGFFEECLRLRRRHRNQWDDAPVAALFCEPPSGGADSATAATTEDGAAPTPSSFATVAAADAVAAKAAARRLTGVFRRDPDAPKALATTIVRIFSRGARGGELPVLSVATLLSHAVSRGRNVFPADILAALLRPHASLASSSMMIGQDAVRAAVDAVASQLAAAADEASKAHTEKKVEKEAVAVAEQFVQWACSACTFVNDPASFQCDICQTPRPGASAARRRAEEERMPQAPDGYWACSVERGGCSKFNRDDLFYCEVCEKARPDLAAMRF